MSKIYFCADTHFSHKNIIKYCPNTRGQYCLDNGDPNTEPMNCALVDLWNSTVNPEDTVYFLGDWALNPRIRDKYIPLLNGKIIWVRGNHDNGIKASIPLVHAYIEHSMIVEIDGNRLFLVHSPFDSENAPADCFVVCGHVHEKWQYQLPGWFVSEYKTREHQESGFMSKHYIINVGLDAWGFKLVSLEQLIDKFQELIRIGG